MFKKSSLAVVTALTMVVGLFAAPAATAADKWPTYQGKVVTTTSVFPTNASHGTTPKVKVRVKAALVGAGNVTPKGSVKLTVKRGTSATVTTKALSSKGGVNFSLAKGTRAGSYSVVAEFIPAAGSEFLGSTGTQPLKISKASSKAKVASAKLAKGKKATVKVRVSSAAKVSGTVRVTITKGKFSTTKAVKIKNGVATVKLGKKLPKAGKYKVTVKFSGNANAKGTTKSSFVKAK